MPKVIVKRRSDSSIVPTKANILKILYENGVNVSGIRVLSDTYHVFCNGDEDVDKLFSEVVVTALRNIDIEPSLPLHVKAKRTILLHNLDPLICEYEAELIKTEIEQANQGVSVDDFFKFPNNKMLKITFASQRMAVHALENGLYIFNLRVPPRNISPDRFVDILVCYRCFKLEDHTSENCDKGVDYIVCSSCSGIGHTFRNCAGTVKCCLNCKGPHGTLTMRCPLRKKIIDEKRKENTKSFASTMKSNFTDSQPLKPGSILFQPAASQLNDALLDANEVLQKSMLCLLVATLKNSESQGCFGSVLNELLRENGLSSFNMGNVTPSVLLPRVSTDTGSPDDIPPSAADAGSLTAGPAVNSLPTVGLTEKIPFVPKSITVYKKRGQPKITADNIDKMMSERKALIDSQMNILECIRLIKANIHIANVIELPVVMFNEKMNALKSKSHLLPVARNSQLIK